MKERKGGLCLNSGLVISSCVWLNEYSYSEGDKEKIYFTSDNIGVVEKK